MKKVLRFRKNFTPIQILGTGYLLVVLFFAMLLALPVSSAKGVSQPFVDALFMAASGISTTGLTVVDIGSYYSLFGQIVLMLDFQIGGIGYMAFFVFLLYATGIRPSIRNQLIATESMAGTSIGYSFAFFKKVFAFTLFFEFIGAAMLCICWLPGRPFLQALYLGIFHSVSAFCTAGFCLFPDSLMSYNNNMVINYTIIIVSLVGAIGFRVINEIFMIGKKRIGGTYFKPLSVHSKLAIMMTIIVVALGTLVIFFSENGAPLSGVKERLTDSLFQAVSASTTDGYNTVNIAAMAPTSLVMIIILMFIGASPGSTGGGVKTTTAGVVILSSAADVRVKEDVSIFKRVIPSDTVRKAFAILLLFIAVSVIDLLILTITEKTSFLEILFEIISALANTGLSMGITPNLSAIGKVLLSLTMFLGRVGPLTIGMALIGKPVPQRFKYAKGEVFVG